MRISLLGDLKFAVDESEPQPIKSNRRLIVYLALQQGRPVPRRTLVADLWPDTDPSVALNRLRVALTQLRSMLGDALLDSAAGIELDPRRVAVDARAIRTRAALAFDEISPDAELEGLAGLLELLHPLAISEFEGTWFLEAQLTWSDFILKLTSRVAILALERRRLGIAATAARVGLRFEPFESVLWPALFRSTTGAERDAVLEEFRQARRRLRTEERRDFPEEVLAIASDAAQGKNLLADEAHPMTDQERAFAGELFGRVAETQPDLALELMTAPEVVDIAVRHLRESSPMLDNLIQRCNRRDTVYVSAIARSMGLKALLDDWEGVILQHRKLDGLAVSQELQAVILNSLGLAKANIRDWSGAMAAAQQTLALHREAKDEQKIAVSLSNLASYTYLQGDFEGGEALFAECERVLSALDGPRVQLIRITLLANRSLIPLMQGKFSDARVLQEECYALCLKYEVHHAKPLVYPILGMLRTEAGEFDGVVTLIHAGLRSAFQLGATRFQQIALEYAAGALGMRGESALALGVLDWVNAWRIRTRHTRAPAEVLLIDHMVDRFKSHVEMQSVSADASPMSVALKVIRRLRDLERA